MKPLIVKIKSGKDWYTNKVDDYFVVYKIKFISENREAYSVELGQYKGMGISIDDAVIVDNVDSNLIKRVYEFENEKMRISNFFKYMSLDGEITLMKELVDNLLKRRDKILEEIKNVESNKS